jgi:hypothetical protein
MAPVMPMSTPFILSAHSKDRELKSAKTVRIPDYIAEDDAGATGGKSSTESDHESEFSDSPTVDGTRYGGKGKGAGDKSVWRGAGNAPPGRL